VSSDRDPDTDDAPDAKAIGRLLSLIVHDLRNPVATLGANLSFLDEFEVGEGEDAEEAMTDMRIALSDLTTGLEQLAWIARWLAGDAPLTVADGDVVAACKRAAAQSSLPVRVEAPEERILAVGGGSLVKLLPICFANARIHAPDEPVDVRVRRGDGTVEVEVVDSGSAVKPELRPALGSLAGQTELKARPGGRYGRAAGWLAAHLVAEVAGARIEADGQDGAAITRIRLRTAG
jgi:signal transduction histidine kinase